VISVDVSKLIGFNAKRGRVTGLKKRFGGGVKKKSKKRFFIDFMRATRTQEGYRRGKKREAETRNK